MSSAVISVDGLGKMYRIGANRGSDGLRHALEGGLRGLGRRLTGRGASSQQFEDFWALRDVSFDVARGECVGIIGRNGAGKSTLLKLLSRITEPTTGEIRMRGRVGSLLEVGTGFHPELTGRENIFLNGAILGMGRREISRKFDEIVAFSEIERFLDTPVKHYSSGMYTRLAFSVAAHLEPDILIVDEVLAVGDAEFQKKCLGKMGEVARAGRTVLFVSHNMGAVSRLCSRAIMLRKGEATHAGPCEEVIAAYLSSNSDMSGQRVWEPAIPEVGRVRLRAVRVLATTGLPCASVDIRKPFTIEMEVDVMAPGPAFRLAVRLHTDDGFPVFNTTDQDSATRATADTGPGRYVSRCVVPGNLLNTGNYTLTPSADVPFVEVFFFEEHVLGFHVEQTGGVGAHYPEKWPGVVRPALAWTCAAVEQPFHPLGEGA